MTARPGTVPQLDTNQTNRTIPAGGVVTDGYLLNGILPSANANFLHGFTGDWLTFFNERSADGAVPAQDLTLQGVVGTAAITAGQARFVGGAAANIAFPVGGASSVVGGAGHTGGAGGVGGAAQLIGGAGGGTASLGGVSVVTGGAGAGTSAGGIASVTGGAGGATGVGGAAAFQGGAGGTDQSGGAITIDGGVSDGTSTGSSVMVTAGAAGSTSGIGGNLTLSSGAAAGTNNTGGSSRLVGGASTGNAGSISAMRAAVAGASGSGVRTPEDFVKADGINAFLELYPELKWVGDTPKTTEFIYLSPSAMTPAVSDRPNWFDGSDGTIVIPGGTDDGTLSLPLPRHGEIKKITVEVINPAVPDGTTVIELNRRAWDGTTKTQVATASNNSADQQTITLSAINHTILNATLYVLNFSHNNTASVKILGVEIEIDFDRPNTGYGYSN